MDVDIWDITNSLIAMDNEYHDGLGLFFKVETRAEDQLRITVTDPETGEEARFLVNVEVY